MALTTPNMALKTWDQLTDNFSHTDLRGNFVAIDVHDHTAGKGVQIPAGGIANLAIGTSQIQDVSVTNVKLAGAITDSKLSTPNNAIYRSVHDSIAGFQGASSLTTYGFLSNGSFVATGVNTSNNSLRLIRLASADYSMGLTTKLRVRAVLSTNAVAPTSTFTIGLHPVTATAGSSGNIQYTIGAATAGSTAQSVAPGASSMAALAGSDFTIPGDGFYALGVVLSVSTVAVGSVAAISAQLQMRHT